MGTPYSVLIDRFYRRIEKDRDFFNYFGLTEEEAFALAKKRSLGYLEEAVALIILKCMPQVDFSNRDDELEQFNFDLNDGEKLLISSLMYQYYLDRDISYLKVLNVNYTSTELRVFDPSNARSTFLEMYQFVYKQNEALMDAYKSTDRSTGMFKQVNFSAYDE